ncbi:MAG: hypothetical protein ACJ76F_04525 [Bacteroidia bacterium]
MSPIQRISGVVLICIALFAFRQEVKAQLIGGLIQEKLDKKKREKNKLEGKKVTGIQISYLQEEASSRPGSVYNMIIKASIEGGNELITEGAGKGKTAWDNYIVEAENASFENGALSVYSDFRKIKGGMIRFKASVKSDPSVVQQVEIPLTYEGDIYVNFSAAGGSYGQQGDNGYGGESNSQWSVGGKGGNGGNGGEGGTGESGPDLEIHAKVEKDPALNKELLYVYVKNNSTGGSGYYAIDPVKAKISVYANGGTGGRGGNGGNGGIGGSGINGGDGGDGGNGNNGGDGGNGGRITLYLDPSAKAYASAIVLNNFGGNGGGSGNAGAGGSGGGSYGGSGGRTGKYGAAGKYSGNAGKNGPAPTILVQKTDISWEAGTN